MTALLFLLAMPAQAEALTQVQVRQMHPGEWNDYWVLLQRRASDLVFQATVDALASLEADPQAYQDAIQKISEVLEQARSSPDWREDEGLKQAVISDLLSLIGELDETLPRIQELSTLSHPRDTHYREAGALWASIQGDHHAREQALTATHAAFAERYRLTTTPLPPYPKTPEFSHTFPGEASALPPIMRCNMSVAHHNEIFEHANAALVAWDVAVDAMDDGSVPFVTEQQQQVQAELARIQDIPPWLGDSTLRDQLVEHLAGLSELMGGVMLQVMALERRADWFSRARTQYNALISRQNQQAAQLNLRTTLVQTEFQERWLWGEVQDYRETLQQWALVQQNTWVPL